MADDEKTREGGKDTLNKTAVQVQVAVRIGPSRRAHVQRDIDKAGRRAEGDEVEWVKTGDTTLQDTERETYTFDRVFTALDSNESVFSSAAQPLIDAALGGFNATIAAYGQSGSGKTHTLTGSRGEIGIAQLTFKRIFDVVRKSDRQYMLRLSYVELYNERIADLLAEQSNGGTELQIWEDSKTDSLTIEGLTEVVITSEEHVEKLLKKANGQRKVGVTNINEHSSRSHAIIRIAIESSDALKISSRCSLLYLLDLAGSECVKLAGTAANEKTRQEAGSINRSLLALSNVISTIAENQTPRRRDTQCFVNYRDSKLTRILKPSLGGNSRTLLICCITPTVRQESMNTIRFAQKARKIENRPVVCEQTEDGMLAKCLKEIEQLKRQLEEKRDNEQRGREDENREREKEAERQKLKELIAQILSGKEEEKREEKTELNRRRRRVTWNGGASSATRIPTSGDSASTNYNSFIAAPASPPPVKRQKFVFDTSNLNHAKPIVDSSPTQSEVPSISRSSQLDSDLLITKMSQETEALRRRMAAIEEEKKQEAEEATQLVAQFKKQITELLKSNEQKLSEIRELRDKNDELVAHNRELQARAEETHSILKDQREESTERISKERERFQKEMERVAETQKKMNEEREEMQWQVENRDRQLKDVEHDNMLLKSRISHLEDEVKLLREEIEELYEKKLESGRQKTTLEQKIDALEQKMQELREENRSFLHNSEIHIDEVISGIRRGIRESDGDVAPSVSSFATSTPLPARHNHHTPKRVTFKLQLPDSTNEARSPLEEQSANISERR